MRSPTGSTPLPSATSESISEDVPPAGPFGAGAPEGVRSGVRSRLNAAEVAAGYRTTGCSARTSSDTDPARASGCPAATASTRRSAGSAGPHAMPSNG